MRVVENALKLMIHKFFRHKNLHIYYSVKLEQQKIPYYMPRQKSFWLKVLFSGWIVLNTFFCISKALIMHEMDMQLHLLPHT